MPWAWASLLIRSAVILGAAELLRRFSRRSAPAYRHRILFASFGLLMLWPVLSAMLPEVRLPIDLPGWLHLQVTGTVTVQQTTFAIGREAREPNVIHWPLIIWAFGVSLALAPLLVGYGKVLLLARRAVPVHDEAWTSLLHELSASLGLRRTPELLILLAPVMPMTFGLRRPRIVLPGDCVAWTPLRRRIVLLHELAHVQRRDVLAQIFASVMTALWWFQPLCWTSRWNLRRESERACDALVLASGIRPSDYAAALLEVAQAFGRTGRSPSAAIAMARRGELECRLYAILDPRPNGRARRLSFGAASVLIAAALTASAVTLLPEKQMDLTTNSPTDLAGGVPMKRTILSGLLASAGLSAATIGGALFDPSGAAVPNAKAQLYNPDTAAKQETTTAPDGKFNFDNLTAGQYILRIEKPGFASLFREFDVQPDSKVDRGLTLKQGSAQQQTDASAENTTASAAPTTRPQQIRVGGAVEESNLITKVQPVYPAAAKAAGIQGTVKLDTTISAEGVPEDIRVISSPSDDLTQSALEAVRQWRYKPTLLNGEPIKVVTDVIVNYTLSR
jgi:TonB family protein